MLSLVLAVPAAVTLDVALGEPRRWHPLVGFGALVLRIERVLNPAGSGDRAQGVLAWCLAVLPLTLLAGLKALLSGRDHLIEPRALQAIVRRALGVRRIEHARIPLHIVAADVLGGEEVLLSSGDLGDALRASTAIPVVFPSVQWGGHRLIDGSVCSNTPIASAVRLGARRIIVLPTGMSCALKEPPRNMAALALHVLSLLGMRQLDRDILHYASQARITVVPPLCPLAVSAFDFSHTSWLIEQARRQCADWVSAVGLSQTGPLDVPLAHRDHAGAVAPHGMGHSASGRLA